MTPENLEDYKKRLRKAESGLRLKASDPNLISHQRWIELDGKARGVRLAIDYLRSYE